MRIVGGTLKGRRFDPPISGWKTRPTTDFAKEALFNVLLNRLDLDAINALDLFAGTGNISFELISRGCTKVTSVEKFGPALKYMKSLAAEWNVLDKLALVRSDVRKYLESTQEKFSFVFADPPYELPWLADLPDMIIGSGCLEPSGWIVLEYGKVGAFDHHPSFFDERSYGQTSFAFFQVNP